MHICPILFPEYLYPNYISVLQAAPVKGNGQVIQMSGLKRNVSLSVISTVESTSEEIPGSNLTA